MSDPIQHVDDQLPQYLDQQLSDADRQAVEAHLQICPECEVKRQELVQMRANPVTPEAPPPSAPPPPEDIDSLLRQDLETPAKTRSKLQIGRRERLILGSVAVGLVLAMMSWMIQMRPRPVVEPAPTPTLPETPPAAPPPAPLPVATVPPPTPPVIAPPTNPPPTGITSGGDSVKELRDLVSKASGRYKSTARSKRPVRKVSIETAEPAVEETPPAEPSALSESSPAFKTEPDSESHILAASEPAAADASFMEWQGLNSGIRKFQTFVIRTPEEMKALWQKHAPGTAAPDVNFDRYMVVGVTKGQTHVRGAAVEVMGSRPSTEGLTVYYREITADGGQLPRMSAYTPYHFKVVPKSSLNVSFQSL